MIMTLYRYGFGILILLCELLCGIQLASAATVSTTLQEKFEQVGVSSEQVTLFSQAIKGINISNANVDAYGQIIVAAQQENIPVNLLLERFNQGILKGVPPVRLQQALVGMQETLVWSRSLISAHVAKAEIRSKNEALVDTYRKLETALRSNISKNQLEQILAKEQVTLEQMSGVVDLAMGLRIANVPEQTLLSICQRTLQAGLTATELDQISQKLNQAMASSPVDANFFSSFEQNIEAEFDLDFSDIIEDLSLESMNDISESILENVTNQLNDVPIDGIEGVVEGLELNPEMIQLDMDF